MLLAAPSERIVVFDAVVAPFQLVSTDAPCTSHCVTHGRCRSDGTHRVGQPSIWVVVEHHNHPVGRPVDHPVAVFRNRPAAAGRIHLAVDRNHLAGRLEDHHIRPVVGHIHPAVDRSRPAGRPEVHRIRLAVDHSRLAGRHSHPEDHPEEVVRQPSRLWCRSLSRYYRGGA